MGRPLPSETPQASGPNKIREETLEDEALRNFDHVLTEAIDGTVSALLSRTVLTALYEHLEKHYSIEYEALPANLKTLHLVLQRTIGFAASTTVERAIAKALYARLKIHFRSTTNLSLLEYVDEAKKNLAAEKPLRNAKGT